MGDELESRVLATIAAVKRIPLERVRLDSSFEELGLDSLDRVNILFELENAFDISISDQEARQIQNVRQVVEGVRRLRAEGAAAP